MGVKQSQHAVQHLFQLKQLIQCHQNGERQREQRQQDMIGKNAQRKRERNQAVQPVQQSLSSQELCIVKFMSNRATKHLAPMLLLKILYKAREQPAQISQFAKKT